MNPIRNYPATPPFPPRPKAHSTIAIRSVLQTSLDDDDEEIARALYGLSAIAEEDDAPTTPRAIPIQTLPAGPPDLEDAPIEDAEEEEIELGATDYGFDIDCDEPTPIRDPGEFAHLVRESSEAWRGPSSARPRLTAHAADTVLVRPSPSERSRQSRKREAWQLGGSLAFVLVIGLAAGTARWASTAAAPVAPVGVEVSPAAALVTDIDAFPSPPEPLAVAAAAVETARVPPVVRPTPAIAVARAAPTAPPVAGDLLLRAARASKAGNWTVARASYSQVLKDDPTNSEALAGLADVARGSSDLDAARAGYQRTLAANPTYMPAMLGLADLQRARGDAAGAAATYRKIVDSFPPGMYPSYVRDRATTPATPK